MHVSLHDEEGGNLFCGTDTLGGVEGVSPLFAQFLAGAILYAPEVGAPPASSTFPHWLCSPPAVFAVDDHGLSFSTLPVTFPPLPVTFPLLPVTFSLLPVTFSLLPVTFSPLFTFPLPCMWLRPGASILCAHRELVQTVRVGVLGPHRHCMGARQSNCRQVPHLCLFASSSL